MKTPLIPTDPHVLTQTAQALLVASGMRADRATILATTLVWHDIAGLSNLGIATLPDLLDRIARGVVHPTAEPKVGSERAALAVLNGCDGPPLLVLARAAELASEKAREYGAGIVRVNGIGPVGSALACVSEIAIGPAAGFAVGPGGAWSLGLPSIEGLPLLADATIGSDRAAFNGVAPWSPMLRPGEWIVQAIGIAAMEPLSSLHERVAIVAKAAPASILVPSRLAERRRVTDERGVIISKSTWAAITAWVERLEIAGGS